MRTAGVLLPLFSLPGPYGTGSMGAPARAFVDFLASAGMGLWQMLPMGPTGHGPGYADSPYKSYSAFAGNPYWIDLDALCEAGLLKPAELPETPAGDARVDYDLLHQTRLAVLHKAAARFNKADPAYRAFCRAQGWWLEDYALFMAVRHSLGGQPLDEWPDALRRREADALRRAQVQLAPHCEFWRCVQYWFFSQWAQLRAHAAAAGVALMGDVPIYISPDSADFWCCNELFDTDADGRPAAVAGVPPDAFSDDGQHWGNPLYNWKAHRRQDYQWWLRRLQHTGACFDAVRIDHFRGFASYYAIPPHSPTARDGVWKKGPGRPFVAQLKKQLPQLRIIAEDLGLIDDEVRRLLAYSGLPGMRVLQFAFAAGADSEYLPHHHVANCVVYTGTHDSPTTEEWAATQDPADLAFARTYLHAQPNETTADALLRGALASVADTAIIPLADWLNLGAEARINTPGTETGNWAWRLRPGQLTPQLARRMRQQAALYRRAGPG